MRPRALLPLLWGWDPRFLGARYGALLGKEIIDKRSHYNNIGGQGFPKELASSQDSPFQTKFLHGDLLGYGEECLGLAMSIENFEKEEMSKTRVHLFIYLADDSSCPLDGSAISAPLRTVAM